MINNRLIINIFIKYIMAMLTLSLWQQLAILTLPFFKKIDIVSYFNNNYIKFSKK